MFCCDILHEIVIRNEYYCINVEIYYRLLDSIASIHSILQLLD